MDVAWESVRRLFFELQDRSPAVRARRLEAVRAERPELCDEVGSLLAAHDADDGEEKPLFRLLVDSLDSPPRPGDVPGPERIGSYRLLEILGRGGMGTVFRARRDDDVFEKRVAIKVINRELATPSLMRRFHRERQILAGLEHPGIARLLDGGLTEDGRPYFVMELVEGEAIDRYCEDRQLSVGDRIRLFQQVLDAVSYAHRNLILHRDLKPENILVDASGRPRLLDFGIAEPIAEESGDSWPTRPDLRPLTPYYASPEQIRGESLSTASDIYSLGVVLHRLVSGASPYRDPRLPHELAAQILDEAPLAPSEARRRAHPSSPAGRLKALRGDVDAIVLKALRKEPERRYTTASELSRDLSRHLEGLAVEAGPDSMFYRTSKFVRRNRVSVLASTVFVATLLGLVGFLLHQRADLRRQTLRATTVTSFVENLVGKADPARNRGLEVTVAEILDQGRTEAESMRRDPATQAGLLRFFGTAYSGLGQYEVATRLLLRALALHGETGDSKERGKTLGALGRVYLEQAEYVRAEEALSESVALLRGSARAEPELLARHLRRLGDAVERLDRFDEAATIYDEARRLLEASDDEEELAHLLRALANLEYQRSDFAESERLQRQALLHLENAKGTRLDIFYPLFLTELATCLRRLSKLDEAEATYLEALEIQRRIHREEHPYIATTLTYLGNLLRFRGQREEAKRHYEEALEIRLATLGPSHPKVANAWINLGNLAADTKEHARAEELYRQGISILEKNQPGSTGDLVTASLNLGMILSRQNRFGDATKRLERALELSRRTYPQPHISAAHTLSALADTAGAQQRYDQATPLYIEAIEMFRELLGPEHPQVAIEIADLADNHRLAGEWAQAEELYDEAIPILSRMSGESHSVTLRAETGRFLVWLESEKYEKVEQRAPSVLQQCRESGADPEWSAEVEVALLFSIAVQGRLEEVRDELRPAYQRLVETLGPDRHSTRIARRLLGELGLGGNPP